jgi:hypothetical protein
MRTYKSIIGSIIGGVAVTLATGLYSNNALIGASWYGFPMTWLRKLVLAPQYNPWRVDWTGVIVDIVIWTVIIEILYFATRVFNRPTYKQPSAKKATRKRKR